MSYKVEVIADDTEKWCSNAVRLATKEEADKYGHDLFSRWLAVRKWQVTESDEPVNYKWDSLTGAQPLG